MGVKRGLIVVGRVNPANKDIIFILLKYNMGVVCKDDEPEVEMHADITIWIIFFVVVAVCIFKIVPFISPTIGAICLAISFVVSVVLTVILNYFIGTHVCSSLAS